MEIRLVSGKFKKLIKLFRQSSVQMLIYGRPLSPGTRDILVAHLVAFASLYSHNLLSLHDTDFFQTGKAAYRTFFFLY